MARWFRIICNGRNQTIEQPLMMVTAQFPITALREIKLLKLLSHRNVLRLDDMAVEHPTRSSGSKFYPTPHGWFTHTLRLSRQAEETCYVHGYSVHGP